ncbi:MAG: hypothetical protein PHC51_01990 [bacterium]|nr:hypothetical protein [bacterium]
MKEIVSLPTSCCCENNSDSSSTIPDCLRCLKMKLRADSLAVFLLLDSGWILEAFEGNIPEEAAETFFTGLLHAGLPEKLYQHQEGLIVEDESALSQLLDSTSSLLNESSLIASPFRYDEVEGVRLALRDIRDPFSRSELEIISCSSICPPGCCEA